jgi:hypothetical protein
LIGVSGQPPSRDVKSAFPQRGDAYIDLLGVACDAVHPSSLLRLKDESDKRQAWRDFLADLRKIASWIEKDAARAAS